MLGTLFIVSTPIGNLKDISMRALDILREVDLILCEDMRVTKKLLHHYEIKTPTLSYHQHSKLKKVEYIIQLLQEGRNLALVSDAGTPGISDPGSQLIKKMIEVESSCPKETRRVEASPRPIKIVPVPGVSAVTAAASVSGWPMDKFIFMGFPPAKKKRKKFFEETVNSKYPVIFYESPYRIIKTLNELKVINDSLLIVVCRELTKKFETIYRGTIKEVLKQLRDEEIRGEFVVVVGK